MNQSTRVFVGFGANLGEPLETYVSAKALLQQQLGPIVSESSMYESRALTLDGSESQTNYFNSVMVFNTMLSARNILRILLDIEMAFQRKREEAIKWAPRPIDLDIIFYGDLVIFEADLVVPHPELHKRDFVLCPLLDVAESFIHPVIGETVKGLENSLDARGYSRLIVRRFELDESRVDYIKSDKETVSRSQNDVSG
jgi:2-amino-4-hydroxy-6-hydroxymethyldihydropteridine diphosphokinase